MPTPPLVSDEPRPSRSSWNISPKYALHLARVNALGQARRLATLHPTRESDTPPLIVCGCGRSGTTLMGELLGLHDDFQYLFEPTERWAQVEPRTDIWGRHGRHGGRFALGAADVSATARRHFDDLFRAPAGRTVVDKTPEAAMRLPFLRALLPDAPFVVMVRSGRDVVSSIAGLAAEDFGLGPFGLYNAWWGRNDLKWHAIEAAAIDDGFCSGDVAALRSHEQRAALEWILVQRSIERWVARRDDNTLLVRYESLIDDPERALAEVADFVRLPAPHDWVGLASQRVRAGATHVPTLHLPRWLQREFDRLEDALDLLPAKPHVLT